MTVFFAMTGEGEDLRPAFFLTAKAAPEGAVEISDARHAALLEALADGKAVTVGRGGKPKIVRVRVDADELRASTVAQIRREAARRIEEISPVWRQLNDTREPSEDGARRFARIDAIRAASNAIERDLAEIPANDLALFPVRDHFLWPEFD